MKIWKRLLSLFLLTQFMAIGAISSRASEDTTYTGPPITIRYSFFGPATHVSSAGAIIPWANLVEKESKGKIVFKFYWNGVLHGSRDGFKACVADITDMTPAFALWQAASFKLLHVLDLPFAFPNGFVGSRVAEELYPKYFKREYEKMGVYLAVGATTGGYNIISKKPIQKLEDLKGIKIRSSGGSASKIIKKLGAVPVATTPNEAYEAFQRGIVDAVLQYDSGIVSYKVHELGKYLTEVKINTNANQMAFNRKTFDNLPKGVKRTFYNQLRRLSPILGEAYEGGDAADRSIIVKSGVKVITLPPEELTRWKDAVEPLWEEFIAENEAPGLPAKQLVQDLRSLTKKYSSWTKEQFMKEAIEHPLGGIIDGM